MRINLTDYIYTFSGFDPNFDFKSSNSLLKAKNCYKMTNSFVHSIDEHIRQYPELASIKSKIQDLNDLFASLVLIQTNGLIKLNDDLTVEIAKSRSEYSHILAKTIVNDAEEYNKFIQSMKNIIDEITKKSNIPLLNENAKLDSIDLDLLSNSITEFHLQDKFVSGAVNINAKTYRSNISLFATRDFQSLAKKEDESKSLLEVVKNLQSFINRVEFATNKFGIIQTNPSNLEHGPY